MKNRLNFIFAGVLVLFTLVTATAQVRFGVKAGLNLASISYSDDYIGDTEGLLEGRLTTGMIPAFHAGGLVEFDFGSAVGLSAGVQLSMKGGSLDLSGSLLGTPFTSTSTARPMYVQVPVAFYYRKSGFYAGVGPYVGFGVAGKIKTKAEVAGQSEEETDDIEFGNDSDDSFAPLDFGAGAEVGYEFGSIRVSASYNLGLANAAPKDAVDQGKDAGRDYKYTHNVIGVSVAYLFGGE